MDSTLEDLKSLGKLLADVSGMQCAELTAIKKNLSSLLGKDGAAGKKIEKLQKNYNRHDDLIKDFREKWMLLEGTVIDVSRKISTQKSLLSPPY